MWIRTIRMFFCVSLLSFVAIRAGQADEAVEQALPFKIFSHSDEANGNDGPSFLESSHSDQQTIRFDLAKLIQRSLLFSAVVIVACLSIVFFNLQKRKRSGPSSKQINVVETQVLGPRCFGDLVQIREQYLFVARDANGIKSVTPLTVAFDTELDEVEESTVDEPRSQPIDSFRPQNQNETWPTKLQSRTA